MAGHGEMDGRGAEGFQKGGDPFAFFPKNEGEWGGRSGCGQFGPQVSGVGAERGKTAVALANPLCEGRVGRADQRDMKDAAHGGPDGGGMIRVGEVADEDDGGDADRMGRSEDGAEVAGATNMLDNEVAKAGAGPIERKPALSNDGADARGSGGEAQGAELFRRGFEEGDTGVMEASGEHVREGAAEKDG
jgi:hypothetical protein